MPNFPDFWIGFIIGCVATGAMFFFGARELVARMLNRASPNRNVNRVMSLALALLMVGVFALAQVAPTFAQEATLEIPTDVIFSQTNSWMNTFAPIAAIGIGITVALAVLGYLGKMIAGAFKL